MADGSAPRRRTYAIMPDVAGATLPFGAIATAQKIANRIVAAEFVRSRKPIDSDAFLIARKACIASLETYPSRAEAQAAKEDGQGHISLYPPKESPEEEPMAVRAPAPAAVPKGPLQLQMNATFEQRQLSFGAGEEVLGNLTQSSDLVEAENRLKGSRDWRILQGKEGHESIICTLAKTTILPGQHLEIHAAHESGCAAEVKIYRAGWYNGNGARLLANETTQLGRATIWSANDEKVCFSEQPDVPLVHTHEDTTDWLPGLHLVRIEDEAGRAILHPFWVSTPDRQSRFLLISPFISLQCQNWWGGANALGALKKGEFQRFTDSRGRFPVISNRRPVPLNHALGLHRPMYNARAGDTFRWYLNLIRWLEREGIAIDHISDHELAKDPSRFTGYDSVVIPPSMRFWTPAFYDAVSALKSRGCNLISLGSMAGFRRVVLDEENGLILAGKSVGGGERLRNPLLHAKFGGWMGGRLEQVLQGTEALGDAESFPGLLSPQWDKLDLDSVADEDDVEVFAKLGDEAVSYLVRHPSRAFTFNAGTMNFAWALDAFGRHGDAEPVPEIMAVCRKLLTHATEADSANPSTLVSVVMTAYKVENHIRSSIQAILDQTHQHLELIIVDDASPDGTWETIREMAKGDARIRPIRMLKNRGTYYAKNFGITQARGEYVTTQDADDLSHPHRISTQLNALSAARDAVICSCNYTRRNADGGLILNRGIRERLSYQSLMWHRKTIRKEVGFFDSTRAAADDEFYNRLKLHFKGKRRVHLNVNLYDALDREGSLTNDPKHRLALTPASAGATAHLSSPRVAYVQSYKEWHAKLKTGEAPYLPFPLSKRRFGVPQELAILTELEPQHITVSMASFPPRREKMLRVVQRILPQVDTFNIYLNDYDEVPAELNDSKIRVVLGKDGAGDLRDNGKYYFLDDLEDGYHLTIDDDIEYPEDYVQHLILKIEQYNRMALVGVHGVIFAQPIERFFVGRTVYTFYKEHLRDSFVNLLGTGTLAYHTSTIQLQFEDFSESGMADVFVAIQAKEAGVPMICAARGRGWMEEMDTEGDGAGDETLWDEFRLADGRQTELVQNAGEWHQPNYAMPFREWVRRLMETHPVDALAIRGMDVPKLLEIGYPEIAGPTPVGLRKKK